MSPPSTTPRPPQILTNPPREAAWPRIIIAVTSFLAGLIAWAAVAVIEFGAWTFIVPPRLQDANRDQPPDESPTHSTPEPITATTPAGTRLSARWYPSATNIPTGRTILLLHGFAEPSSAWESARAPFLSQHGWNVVAIDARGYGNSQPHFSSFGAHEAEDVSVWLDFLNDRTPKLDPSRPFVPILWGRSMGTLTALRTASTNPSVAGLILESPLFDVIATVATVLRARRIPLAKLFARLMLRRAGSLVHANLTHPTPSELAAKIERPTLIVHGENDKLIPILQARHLASAFPSSPNWISVPSAGHSNVITIGGDPLLTQIAAFLEHSFPRESPSTTLPLSSSP